MQIRKAEKKDLEGILAVIQDGRFSLKEAGIPQWQGSYPAEIDILKDLRDGGARVIEKEGIIKGYCFLRETPEPAYGVIKNGTWLNEEPYIALHRLVVVSCEKGKHLADLFLKDAEALGTEKNIHNLRTDTHEKNISMRAYLNRNGFRECGIIHVEDGTPRIAYQKVLK